MCLFARINAVTGQTFMIACLKNLAHDLKNRDNVTMVERTSLAAFLKENACFIRKELDLSRYLLRMMRLSQSE